MEFVKFDKIARLSRTVVITEKIDGTNGLIAIGDDGKFQVGNRFHWITPQDDPMGFARWAYSHKDELMGLGVSFHRGEWWGLPDANFGKSLSVTRHSLNKCGNRR